MSILLVFVLRLECLAQDGNNVATINQPTRRQTLKSTLSKAKHAVMAVSAGLCMTAAAQPIAMETAAAGSVLGLMPQGMATAWSEQGVQLQLATGQTLTKSLLKMAKGTLDTAIVPPTAYAALKKGVGPYSSLGDKGAALAGNVRSLFSFGSSTYHMVVWADSGSDDWSQIKGKRVFIGPPAGAANAMIRSIVKAGSGFEDGKDYEGVKAPWNAAMQNFKDGQFDMFISTLPVGSQALVELGLTKPFRLLSVPADKEPSMGFTRTVIPANTYPDQVNKAEDVTTWVSIMTMMAKKDLSDDVAYKLTKTYFEQLPAVKKSNSLLAILRAEDRFASMQAPLHPGALKYYQEAGVDVPARLIAQ